MTTRPWIHGPQGGSTLERSDGDADIALLVMQTSDAGADAVPITPGEGSFQRMRWERRFGGLVIVDYEILFTAGTLVADLDHDDPGALLVPLPFSPEAERIYPRHIGELSWMTANPDVSIARPTLVDLIVCSEYTGTANYAVQNPTAFNNGVAPITYVGLDFDLPMTGSVAYSANETR